MSDEHERIIRINAVMDRTGLHPATLYRKMSNGTFPSQIRISTRCAGWRESAVNAWLKSLKFYDVADYPRD